VVDMRVRQEDEVEARRREREGAVIEALQRLRALEQAAVDEEGAAVVADPERRAGDGAGGAAETEDHSHAGCGTAPAGSGAGRSMIIHEKIAASAARANAAIQVQR